MMNAQYIRIIAITDAKMRLDVKEYYEYAPQIANRISGLVDCKIIFKRIYTELVCPCVKLIKDGQNIEAYNLYKSFYNKLKDEYL